MFNSSLLGSCDKVNNFSETNPPPFRNDSIRANDPVPGIPDSPRPDE